MTSQLKHLLNKRHLFTDPPGDNFGLLAIGNEIDLPRGKGEFWRIADRFHAKTKEMLANPRKALSLMAPLDYVEPTLFDHSVIEQGMMESFKNKFLQNIHEAAND